jgi:hypothetical protein
MPMSASSPTTTPAPIEALWPTVTLAPRVVGAGAEEEEEEEAEFSMSSGVVRTVAPSWTGRERETKGEGRGKKGVDDRVIAACFLSFSPPLLLSSFIPQFHHAYAYL